MSSNASKPAKLVNVRGTELLAGDTREQYRQKLARITLDSMVQFVGLLDAKGTVLEINQVALDAVGIKLSDVEGKPFWTTFWWQVSEEINATLRESIVRASQGEFVRWDAEIFGRFGGKETIIIDASLMPVKDEQGNVVFITAEGRDITEKKAHERELARQREELAELDELKTQFFANISHEFRTPLTLMMGPLEDAIGTPEGLTATNRERLEVAHRNSLRLLKLVNTLLDFSRIEAGRIQASYEPTDLAQLTAELASMFRSAIERAGMRLKIDCPPLTENVYLDREMWEKIVLNLLSNAFKFTFEGEIEVSIRCTDSAVEMKVRDTGTGIAAGDLPFLFDRFHRVKGARGRSYEGSGIGLALVQELVHLHGGTVRIESEVDRGSTFIVTIPLGSSHLPPDRIGGTRTLASTVSGGEAYVQEALRWLPGGLNGAEEIQGVDVESLPASSADGLSGTANEGEQRSRILLADDNADMREYVQRLLSEKYDVVTVADGESALKRARAQRPDLILSDVMMPRLDGFGLLRELRADEDLKSIPLILLSARAGEESRVEGLDAGADDYLAKPFSARELMARAGSHLAMAKIRREAADQFRTLSERLEGEVRQRTNELEARGDALLKQSEQMRELSRRLLQVQDDERRRIARELHDSTAQVLTALSMNLTQMQKSSSDTNIEKFEECRELISAATTQIRNISYLLHPPLIDEVGLISALREYAEGFEKRSGIAVSVEVSTDIGRLVGNCEIALFRILQESLGNILRHSGSATASIRLFCADENIVLEIGDRGRGMQGKSGEPANFGVGIRSMQERIREFGGTLQVESNGNGTKVKASLPRTAFVSSEQEHVD